MPNTIDEYIAEAGPEIRGKLAALRNAIREIAPEATEKISWGMASFAFHGALVHFAVQKHHIGFYPGSSGVEAFRDRLVGYKFTKGGIQFPKEDEVPLALVREIVAYRIEENIKAAEEKKQAKLSKK